jgi:hypothetical protein
VRPTDSWDAVADHRRVAHCRVARCRVVVSVALVTAVGGLRLPVQGELRERARHNERCRSDDQTPARQASFSHV